MAENESSLPIPKAWIPWILASGFGTLLGGGGTFIGYEAQHDDFVTRSEMELAFSKHERIPHSSSVHEKDYAVHVAEVTGQLKEINTKLDSLIASK